MSALYIRSSCLQLGKAADRSHLAAASVTCLQRSRVSYSGWLTGNPSIVQSGKVRVADPDTNREVRRLGRGLCAAKHRARVTVTADRYDLAIYS